MKANLIGVGYWGSFIYKTLKEIGFTEIGLCDPVVPGSYCNYKKMQDAPFVFIATPVSTHFEICKYLSKKIILQIIERTYQKILLLVLFLLWVHYIQDI